MNVNMKSSFRFHLSQLDAMMDTTTAVSDPPVVKSKRCSIASCSTSSTKPPTLADGDDSQSFVSYIDQTNDANSDMYTAASQKLFPYHVVVNRNLQITAVGNRLSRLLESSKNEIIGQRIDRVLSVFPQHQSSAERPIWTWDWLASQEQEEDEHESFRVVPAPETNAFELLCFKANVVHVDTATHDSPSSQQAMINMVPDASTATELLDMDLTTSDMPVHGEYREALELRERLEENAGKAQELQEKLEEKKSALELRERLEETTGKAQEKLEEKKIMYKFERSWATAGLSKALQKEKELLESLVPKHVADGLRKGENVPPRLHENVTFFFSDVMGFTDMCKQLYPWQVIGMLNRLYCVMDHLLVKFGLFKVETIGDAYVCCSGLPESDENHAEKVANFAVAVSKCVTHIRSPVDGKPIQLRIGVHTGTAASGVVGVKNPRYCVFGDTVNVTARHESSGEAGRVHCSSVTQRILASMFHDRFTFIERGLVEMKGKGKLKTFWLESSEANGFINNKAMEELEIEIDDLLKQTKFESELEKENNMKNLALFGELGKSSLSEEQEDVMGPILDIIRRELRLKNGKTVKRTMSSGDVEKSPKGKIASMSLSLGQSLHISKDREHKPRERKPRERKPPARSKSYDGYDGAM
jgi:class 3 adenylate cyclase